MVPSDIPVNVPEVLMLPVAILLLLHDPPVVSLLKVVVAPSHTKAMPVMAAGSAFMVSMAVLKQPAGREKVMVLVPAERPVMIPVMEPTAATDVLLLLQEALPDNGSESMAVAPLHMPDAPRIALGCRFTVATVIVLHPAGNV